MRYDYERQEANFDNSVSRIILELRGDILSTDWSLNELKTLVGKIVAKNGEDKNRVDESI